MKMRNLFLVVLCSFFVPQCSASGFGSMASAVAKETDSLLGLMLSAGAMRSLGEIGHSLMTSLDKMGYKKTGVAVLAILALSLAQKESPEFFNTATRWVEWPFLVTQKKLQKLFCGGTSLTWNDVASWHNRIARLLTPLTKATSMVDLSKDRRLKMMDQEDRADAGQDSLWKQQVDHIERECAFMHKILTVRLAYYEDKKQATKRLSRSAKAAQAITGLVKPIGKAIVRTSMTRDEEIAFGIKEAMLYLKETADYCKSVPHFSALDKEHMKRLMGNICTTFEHIGVLVDELSAADRTKKKLQMTADGSLTKSYSGSSYGSGYDSAYGTGGSYN